MTLHDHGPSSLSDEAPKLGLRKFVTQVEDTNAEFGRGLDNPLRRALICAVFRNPSDGQGFVEDLWDEMNRVARIVSLDLAKRALEVMGPHIRELLDGTVGISAVRTPMCGWGVNHNPNEPQEGQGDAGVLSVHRFQHRMRPIRMNSPWF